MDARGIALLCLITSSLGAADACPACAGCALRLSVASAADLRADTGVSMTSALTYVQMDVTIAVGDTVTWHNTASFAHTTTSDGGLWDSGPIAGGGSFQHQFTTEGTFPYHCTIHGAAVMHGTVTVVSTPVVGSAATAHGTAGSPFDFAVSASESPTSFGATGLPTGLTIDTGTGVISGTPSVAGSFPVDVSATNVAGTGHQTLNLTVDASPIGAPVITSATTAAGAVGSAFTYTIAATDAPNAFTASPLPAGLSVDTGTGAITGMPTAAGTTDVTISAANASGTATTGIEITIAAGGGTGTGGSTTGGSTTGGSGTSGLYGGSASGGGHGCGRGSGAGLAALGMALLLAGARRPGGRRG